MKEKWELFTVRLHSRYICSVERSCVENAWALSLRRQLTRHPFLEFISLGFPEINVFPDAEETPAEHTPSWGYSWPPTLFARLPPLPDLWNLANPVNYHALHFTFKTHLGPAHSFHSCTKNTLVVFLQTTASMLSLCSTQQYNSLFGYGGRQKALASDAQWLDLEREGHTHTQSRYQKRGRMCLHGLKKIYHTHFKKKFYNRQVGYESNGGS